MKSDASSPSYRHVSAMPHLAQEISQLRWCARDGWKSTGHDILLRHSGTSTSKLLLQRVGYVKLLPAKILHACLSPWGFCGIFSFLIHIETLSSHITFTPPYKSHLLNTTLFSLFRISVLLWRERRRSIDHVIQDASQTPHIDLILSKILMPLAGKWRGGTPVDFLLWLCHMLFVFVGMFEGE